MRAAWGLVVCLAFGPALAQTAAYRAVRADSAPVIDGDLSDPAWTAAPEIGGFVQRDPDEGKPATETTVVKVLYDDRAIYFGAYLHDAHPVTSRLGRRDATVESDWFRIYLDPMLDGRTGATFQVNPANVQYDAVLHSDSISDPDWDGVWQSATRIVPDGWIAEIAIPLSQLRFRDVPMQTWGINLGRSISRRAEVSRLVFTPKNDAGFVSRFAHLTGLEGIPTRKSLELLPYAAVRVDDGELGGDAGLDLKHALTSDLTLTATINPDFGQVEVDPARVNLTQYELFFPEKRPFFVEGSAFFDPEVISNHIFDFNFTSPLLFYSRRIGRAPRLTDTLGAVGVPEETTILGAGKVTGRTRAGWTFAALDAVTDKEKGSVAGEEVAVEPATNYLVTRVGHDLGGHAAVGARLTAVNRKLDPLLEPFLHSSAYAAGADGYRTFKDNTYVLQWTAESSRVDGSEAAILQTQRSPARYYQRPDAEHVEVDPTRTSLSGYGGSVLFAKHAGTWQYNLQTAAYSPGFETNDVGFMPRADILTTHGVLLYSGQQPWKNTRRRNFWIAKFQHWNFDGDLIQNGLWFDANVLFTHYTRAYAWGGTERRTIDDRATRGGFAIEKPRQHWVGGQIGSDTKKRFFIDAWTEILRDEAGGWSDVYAIDFTWRPTSRVSLRLTPSYRDTRSSQQYVTTRDGRYVFARLDQSILELAARLDWTFTSRLSLQLYLQPYVATGDYEELKEPARPRSLDFVVYGKDAGTIAYDPGLDAYTIDPDGAGAAEPFTIADPDFNFRSLRANLVLRWEFRRGSTFYAVWNENREDVLPIGDFNARRDLGDAFQAPSRDVFLVKTSYWWGR